MAYIMSAQLSGVKVNHNNIPTLCRKCKPKYNGAIQKECNGNSLSLFTYATQFLPEAKE